MRDGVRKLLQQQFEVTTKVSSDTQLVCTVIATIIGIGIKHFNVV